MKDKKKRSRQDESPVENTELSATWRELLGQQASAGPEKGKNAPDGQKEVEVGIPTLESDPWSTLIQAKGVEVVDLHKTRLQISDQEVEQMLQVIQEQSAQQDDEGSSSKQH